MNLDLISELWDVLRNHVDMSERKDAADTLVNWLIENNYEPDEIKDAFRGDKEVFKALAFYVDQHDLEEIEDPDEENDFDEDEW